MFKGVVSKVNVFSGLNRAQLDELTSWLGRVEFRKGDIIFREGDKSNGLYLLCNGEVAVTKQSAKGVFKLTELEGPSFFGEASLLINVPRTASVRALTNVQGGLLPISLFRTKLNQRNLTAFLVTLNISRLLAERVDQSNRRLALGAARVKTKMR